VNESRQLSVLLIDDDADQLYLIERAARKSGYFHTIETSLCPEKALSVLHNGFRPDVIISDFKMPKMTGADLIKSLKSDPELSKIHIVVISTAPSIGDRKYEVEHFYVKPHSSKELRDIITDIYLKACNS